ncbi:MAG TPA: FG-GAP-like repeat-containing protein, partial [Gemmatimonadales bacterium]|nr:FG-GAP-like repeat-containing protein [Gemmatimonadales bacterium]
ATHYLGVKLEGDSTNRGGIGATLTLTAGGRKQYLYHSPYRGYMSTMDAREHFGLGTNTRVDSLEVRWPDGRTQLLTDVAADQTITIKQQAASAGPRATLVAAPLLPTSKRAFERLPSRLAPRYAQSKTEAVDFETQPLLPYQISRQGPPLAVGDVNGDGLEDLYVGGANGSPGLLLLQRPGGGFVDANAGQPWPADRAFTDWGATFFDANGDGRLDLYVASGGYQNSPTSPRLQDRLYINRGGGRFTRDTTALPRMLTSTGAIAVGDFNGDGKPDLFVGGRVTPMNYPFPTRSYILRNDGGHFTDVTADVCPELINPGGMITAAVWIDWDGDGRPDLVTAGEWMPLEFYHNEGGRLRNVTAATGAGATRGWWFSLIAADFNHDGRPDLVAGNLGENAAFMTSPASRFGVYAGNLSGGQVTDVVLTQEISGIEYPYFGRATLGPSLYTIALRVPGYANFAHSSMEQLFGRAVLQHALHYQTDTFASVYLQNEGSGKFAVKSLPKLAQIAPIRGLVPYDVDGDGNLDLIAAGNLFATEANTAPFDAGNGVWLRGDGHGTFGAIPPATSGFLAPGEVTGLALIKTPAGSAVLVANSGDSLQAFTIRNR